VREDEMVTETKASEISDGLFEPMPEGGWRSRCAWCQADMGPAPEGCDGHSHGVCKKCKDDFMGRG
jgi:hypothetical protein